MSSHSQGNPSDEAGPVPSAPERAEHTPRPWGWFDGYLWSIDSHGARRTMLLYPTIDEIVECHNEADRPLIAAAPDLYEALKDVNKLIAEAAMTGFNWKVGDWTERLFHSQQKTSAALSKAQPEGGER